MNVYLTFDIEVWCNGWDNLDSVFPGNFERYVFGSSQHGSYALPKTLEILNRHGLKGVFLLSHCLLHASVSNTFKLLCT